MASLKFPAKRVRSHFLAVAFTIGIAQQTGPALGASRAVPTPGSFPTEVLPILTKAGCNSGACHGAATGQGGFKLSLLGYDPEADHEAITRELGGRRINLASPSASLLLRKPTRAVAHKGGRRIEPKSADHERLKQWIASGAPFGDRELRVESLRVEPEGPALLARGKSVPLRVEARTTAGVRDATEHALFSVLDDSIAEVDASGRVTVRGRGMTAVMIRFGGQVASVRVGAQFNAVAVKPADFPTNNFIDEKVLAELQRLGLPPSPPCDDATFLRRVTLDVAGRLPTAEEVRELIPAPSPNSPALRSGSISRLLASADFTDFWTYKLADLLLINSRRLGDAPARAYHAWLRQQISSNAPLDRIARELLTATGESALVGPANFHRLTRDPRDMGEFVSRTFLGTQLACARCHAHPFAGWSQDDYHRFAAFFARTQWDGERILVANRGEVPHPKTGKNLEPRFLVPLPGALVSAVADRRVALSEWMSAPENPLFARAFVNRVWKELMGRGLVEPADDLRVSNPPTNPALLDALAADFIAHKFDLRRLVRTIVSSRAYQLDSRATELNRADDRFGSHAITKPLPAVVLADAIAQVTGVPLPFSGWPAGTRAVQLLDAQTPSYTLDVFGRCSREAACESSSRSGGGLAQALHFINGPALNEQIRAGAAALLRGSHRTDEQLVEELWLRSLSRSPEPKEREWAVTLLAKSASRQPAVEDLLWALLNTREFAVNH